MNSMNMPGFTAEKSLLTKGRIIFAERQLFREEALSLLIPQMRKQIYAMVSECGVDCSSGYGCQLYCCWENPITKTSQCSFG